jgi:hypothetical protein
MANGIASLYATQPLNSSANDTRLLHIKPNDRLDAPIVCDLRVVSLQDPNLEEFFALSYVWGPPRFDDSVLCNGTRVPITATLYAALERLRCCEVELLWVDQICIYQDRYRSKCCRNWRVEPQFCEGVGFAHLACRIGKFTLRVFTMEIYQYIAFYLHLTIPPSRHLARSSSQYDHVSLL